MHLPPHLERILDLARWAPSGDNTQPWRFEILGDGHILVHGFDTREHCVYDLDGHASQLAIGALLETLCLAATSQGRRTTIHRRTDTPDTHLLFDVHFEVSPDIVPDPLVPYIDKRTVQRRAMSTRQLTAEQKNALSNAVGPNWRVTWFEGLPARWRMAKLMFDNAKLRLTLPEAFEVHQAVIEWGARFSEDKVPDQAVGANPIALRFMRWAMHSWSRVDFLNTWLLGHLMPRIELDLLPGLRCAAHFALVSREPPTTVDDYVAAGRTVQRFWLTATRLGLQLQPEMTPLIFGRYATDGRQFSRQAGAEKEAGRLRARLESLLGRETLLRTVFLGRLGADRVVIARSLRLPLPRLMHRD